MTVISVTPIRTFQDYERSLERLEMIFDALPGSTDADELDVLATLIERFENDNFKIDPPTALDAIRFRMDQQGLSNRDLEPILGSRARVSEVLNGSRHLTLDMIRALHSHLDIPAGSLIAEDQPAVAALRITDHTQRILANWGVLHVGENLHSLFARALGSRQTLAMLRKTRTDRANAKSDVAATQAWCAAALQLSKKKDVQKEFDQIKMGKALRSIANLSAQADGVERVEEALSNLGVALIALPHLPKTYLDGAAMLREDGTPVVALTLRRDQIDAFWFTLLHELAHVYKDLTEDIPTILDDLEISSSHKIERDADRLAQESLIPPNIWNSYETGEFFSKLDLESLAKEANVHPAIVAGRWRIENKNYKRFSNLLGHRSVRSKFPNWVRMKERM